VNQPVKPSIDRLVDQSVDLSVKTKYSIYKHYPLLNWFMVFPLHV